MSLSLLIVSFGIFFAGACVRVFHADVKLLQKSIKNTLQYCIRGNHMFNYNSSFGII